MILQQVLSCATTTAFSEALVKDFLTWFTEFKFDQRALVMGSKDVPRTFWGHPIFVHPFLNVNSIPGSCFARVDELHLTVADP